MTPTPRSNVSRAICGLLVAGVMVGFLVGAAAAQDILAGIDLLETEPGTTDFDFGVGPPLPADFFGPGSDPFDGVVSFDGSPFGSSPFCPNDDLTVVSTLVQRMVNAVLPSIPSSDVIPTEIVELSLVSSSPITVTYFGGTNPELWDVEVGLSVNPQPTGLMTITRTHANGGTFDIALPVLPVFTFTRQSDSQVVELDFGLAAMPPVDLESLGVPWEDKSIMPGSCTTNWCPSPNIPFVLTGPNASHGVRSVCPTSGIPTLSTGMTAVLLLLLVVLGVVWMRRRSRRASA